MCKQEINKEFIDDLRLNLALTRWSFDSKHKITEIVPKELTHNYLLENFNIDNSILRYYCLPSSRLLTDKEFQKMVKSGIVGEKETVLLPYSNIIYGAYYSRSDLEFKLMGISSRLRPPTINKKEIKYFTDLTPYFKEYAKGFENGFSEFNNKQIKPFFTLLAEKQDYVNKVFEYITKTLFFKPSWATSTRGFRRNQDNEIIEGYEDGQQQGYWYRAWSVIFSNNNLFAPLFQKHIKPLPPQSKENTKIQSQEILDKQNTLIPKVPIKEVYDHFKVLTTMTNKYDEFILTDEQLSKFIKNTFINNKPVKQDWNCKTFIKKDIRIIFYRFYTNCKNKEKNYKKLKQKYFDILDKSFEGFIKNDYNDFHKT